ncbi:hypothetical protein ACHAPO_006249 [Fusarium lateritium]
MAESIASIPIGIGPAVWDYTGDPSPKSITPSAVTPFPVAFLEEPESPEQRYYYANKIQDTIRQFNSKFCIRVEHLATILLISFESLEIKGYLCHESHLPQVLETRLKSISPFCKHYMLHLNPNNLDSGEKREKWIHALPKTVEASRELESDMSYNDFLLAIHSRSSFVTNTGDPRFPKNKGKREQTNCRLRDANQCVLTQRPNPSVFWFIPEKWNHNATHNDATGNLEAGCLYLTDIDLLHDLHSASELGKTHRVWNMICVDKVIRDLLMEGLCAFKFISRSQLDDTTFEVLLEFFWMPRLIGRFNQPMDLNTFINGDYTEKFNHEKANLVDEIRKFSNGDCSPEPDCQQQLSAISSSSLSSGHRVLIQMPEQESKLFESVVKIHWACVTFTALCGGAGRAWHLTGENQRNGSLEPRDEAFEESENERKAKEEAKEKEEKKKKKKKKKRKRTLIFGRKKEE